MHLTSLRAVNLRCFSEFTLTPVPGVNLLLGENGAGKTSILEAIHILGYGRSFRGRIRDGLIKQSQGCLQITVRWQNPAGQTQQAGFQHTGSDWSARMDGRDVDNLSQFCEHFPVISFEPGSHELISGTADHRRRFVDWALFHVEPEFTLQWRRFHRALKQRNALLKRQPKAVELASWDAEYADAGEELTRYRRNYLNSLGPKLREIADGLMPECGELNISFQPGWRDMQISLLDALRLNRDRDIQSGFCGIGPHRADWTVRLGSGLQQEHFSRGQAKLLALAAMLAQAHRFVEDKGFWPVLCFDDIASELDYLHSAKVAASLKNCPAQIWITGTEASAAFTENFNTQKTFHVERGMLVNHP